MRTMKEPNYSQLRELIRKKAGGIVLNMIRDNQQLLDLEHGIFDLAFEGFWDLYTFNPQVSDLNGKKLLSWIPKIKLQVNEMTGVPAGPVQEPAEGEEPVENQGAQPPYDPISAVVRIRIAKKYPEAVEDEDGNPVVPEFIEEELEEIPIDDKCLSVVTNSGEQSIFCINQAAGRVVRQDLIKEMSTNIDALKGLDLTEFSEACEKVAESFETKFISLFSESTENKASDKVPRVPVFDFAPQL
jgi:hypothetical protein